MVLPLSTHVYQSFYSCLCPTGRKGKNMEDHLGKSFRDQAWQCTHVFCSLPWSRCSFMGVVWGEEETSWASDWLAGLWHRAKHSCYKAGEGGIDKQGLGSITHFAVDWTACNRGSCLWDAPWAPSWVFCSYNQRKNKSKKEQEKGERDSAMRKNLDKMKRLLGII